MSSETSLKSTNNKTLINIGSSSEVDNLIGTVVFGKYTLLNKINDPSGEAALYMATCTTPSQDSSFQNSPVVVKIYRRKNAIKSEVLNKLAGLKSPNIVEILEHGSFNGFSCIVMPYFKNGSLSGKTLSYDVIKDIVIPEVTAGLKYLHENGIIHKDIKPANLMVSDDEKHIHIIDFGISSAKDDGVSVLITKTGMSPEYCAPETFNNVWVEESDFYSFGITLFELFKGFTPFHYSSDRDELIASASMQKIQFSSDFPEELVNLIKGLTYKDLSNRNDLNNPNRRWNWNEIEKWLSGENIPVPGELNSNPPTFDLTENTNKSSAYIFSKPYDFRNNKGQVVKLNNLSEFTEALGLNWEDGKKHVGRGFASKFFIQQDMQNIANIIIDCEEAATTNIAYAKMLIELGLSTNNHVLYWKSVKVDGNIGYLSDILTEKLFNDNNNLNEEFENIKQLLFFWYEISGKNKELDVIKKLQKIADEDNQDLPTQVTALCSFIEPNIIIKIGNDTFQNTDELVNFSDKIKLDKRQYFDWLLNNQKDITRYTGCVIPAIKQITENLLQDLMSELNRRKEEQERRQREEQERKQREIQIFGMEISDIKVGSFITYGRYFQDSNSSKSPIEWLVLDVKGNEALLISRYALDCMQYHKRWSGVTWEACELRTWLNNDFMISAFSDEEAERILVSDLKNANNPKYLTRGGNDTKDRIFCLSIDEAKQYFNNDNDRICEPTFYARQQFANVNWSNNNKRGNSSYWWLRSTGSYQNYALYVGSYGEINELGGHIYHYHNVVRPALRIVFNEEQARKEREELVRKEREEQARKEREEQARKEREEQARKEREEQARKEREEQARKKREEQARKKREELARRERDRKEREEQKRKELEKQALRELEKELEEQTRKERERLARRERAKQERKEREILAQKDKKQKIAIASLVFCLFLGVWGVIVLAEMYERYIYAVENPILNSPDDITDELLQRIIENKLQTLTINYEFTHNIHKNENTSDRSKNPFYLANKISPLKKIQFTVKFGANVHSLASAFEDFNQLNYVNIKDTSNIEDMSFMFSGAKLFNQPIGNWNTSKVKDMNHMFSHASLFNQPIDNWDTSNVENMSYMFSYTTSFNQQIDKWNISSVRDMNHMFSYASSFDQSINKWDLFNVTNINEMFTGAESFDKKSFIEGQEQWKNQILNSPNDITDELIQRIINNNLTSITINYEFTSKYQSDEDRRKNNPFYKANLIKPIKRMEFKIILGPNVHLLVGAFKDFYELEYINIEDTSNITDMSYLFYNAKVFNQPIDNWNTSNVTDMSCMFFGAKSFNQPLNKWDVSKVRTMDYMFYGATSFRQPLTNWNLSKISRYMMFY